MWFEQILGRATVLWSLLGTRPDAFELLACAACRVIQLSCTDEPKHSPIKNLN